MVEDY